MGISQGSNFEKALASLKREGRYRIFADIMRSQGAFPAPIFRTTGASSR